MAKEASLASCLLQCVVRMLQESRKLAIVILLSAVYPAYSVGSPLDSIQIRTFNTHSRLTFSVDDSVPVEWQNHPTGFSIFFKGIGLSEFGAPMGEEDRWKTLLGEIQDSRVGSVRIEELSGGVRISGQWKYPEGKNAPAHPAMEFFEYREKTPPQYVVDFWYKQGPTLVEVKESERRARFQAVIQKTQEEAKRRIERRLASEKQRAEAENSSRFCDQPLSENNDVFLEFYPVHHRVDFTRWLPITTADTRFRYFKPKKRGRDTQYVRLALELYGQGNFALATRTLDFLEAEFPKSNFQTEMKFLRANCLLKLGLELQGEKLLKELIVDAKDSPVALHSAMFLATKSMESGNHLLASESFLWLVQNYPYHSLNWVFHLGSAESFYALGQIEQAAKEYRWIIDNAPNHPAKAEAAYRVGDLYLGRFQYEQALEAYFHALNYFSKESRRFPGFFLNRGEVLYQLGQYDRARGVFQKFLEQFSGHPQGWRASFRLGEIEGRTFTDEAGKEKSREWFYETINHFPYSPGATLARVRLIPCGDHGGFTLNAAERFFRKSKDFESGGEVVVKKYPDLRALAHVRALITLGTQDQTALTAIHELPMVKMPFIRSSLTTIANDFFQKMILRLLAEGKKFEALSYYSAVAPNVPPPDALTDVEYLLKLSQAAADLELGNLAAKLAERYQKVVTSRKTRSPASSTIESQISKSEQDFTSAKALWIASRAQPNATEDLKKIRELLEQVKEESKFSYEKELILGLLDEKEGKGLSAFKHAARAQLMASSPSVDYWAASLAVRAGEPKIALDIYRNLEKKLLVRSKEKSNEMEILVESLLGVPDAPALDRVLVAEAEILERMGKWGEAASAYSRALDGGSKASQVMYQFARTASFGGTLRQKEKSRGVLQELSNSKIKDKPEDFWQKLAVETLADEKSRMDIQNAKEGKK